MADGPEYLSQNVECLLHWYVQSNDVSITIFDINKKFVCREKYVAVWMITLILLEFGLTYGFGYVAGMNSQQQNIAK